MHLKNIKAENFELRTPKIKELAQFAKDLYHELHRELVSALGKHSWTGKDPHLIFGFAVELLEFLILDRKVEFESEGDLRIFINYMGKHKDYMVNSKTLYFRMLAGDPILEKAMMDALKKIFVEKNFIKENGRAKAILKESDLRAKIASERIYKKVIEQIEKEYGKPD